MKMNEQQFALIKEQLRKLTSQECFYKHKLEGINVDDILKSSPLHGRAT